MKRIFTLIICGVVFFLPCIAYPKDLNKGFAILPPVVDFFLSPGSTKIFPLELWNKSETDKAAIKIYPASIRELEGMQGLEDEKWSCVSWIDVMPKQVTLLPGEHKAITAKITIPQGAPVSSKYATIIFEHLPEASYSSLKPKDDESVISYSIVWRLASIVRLTITGPGIKKELAITKLDVLSGMTLSSELSTEKDKKEDLIFQLGMENKGNVHLEPEGEIVIRTEKGIRKGAVPVRGFRVYPSLNREIKLDYNTLLPVGEYTAEAVLNYGGTQPARIKEAFSISSNEDKKTGNEKFSFISKEKKITITPLSLEPKILTLKYRKLLSEPQISQ